MMTHFVWKTPDGKFAYYIRVLGQDLPPITGFSTMGEADRHALARRAELTRKPLLCMGDVELQNARLCGVH